MRSASCSSKAVCRSNSVTFPRAFDSVSMLSMIRGMSRIQPARSSSVRLARSSAKRLPSWLHHLRAGSSLQVEATRTLNTSASDWASPAIYAWRTRNSVTQFTNGEVEALKDALVLRQQTTWQLLAQTGRHILTPGDSVRDIMRIGVAARDADRLADASAIRTLEVRKVELGIEVGQLLRRELHRVRTT